MRITANSADAYKLIHDGVLALARAERQGIRIDTEYCERMKQRLTRRITRLEKQIRDTKLYRLWERIYGTKTNIYSNHQLSRLLYTTMKIEPPKLTASGGGSTDEEALSRIDVPGIDTILRIRKLNKVRDTYLDAFIREQHDGYIHPFFNLHTVRTYRSSSSDPNFQNIPKRDKEALKICRGALYPRRGHMLVSADFSALEVMISACYHKDPTMLKYLKDKRSDMHLDMAKQIFIFEELDRSIPEYALLRQAAKNGFVFPQFYGDYYGNNAKYLADWVKLPHDRWKSGAGVEMPGGDTIADHFRKNKVKSFDAFIEHMKEVENDFWNNRFRVYNAWRETQIRKYRERGYLRMLTGFTCSGVMRRNEIVNYPIQGAAFHCLLFTFNRLDEIMRKEKWNSKLIGQIHDEIVMDVHPDELSHIEQTARRIVKEDLPAAWKWIIVPLEIDVEKFDIDGPWVK